MSDNSPFLLAVADPTLPGSRKVTVGQGLAISDLGPQANFVISPGERLSSLATMNAAGFVSYNPTTKTYTPRTLYGSASIAVTSGSGSGNPSISQIPNTTVQQVRVANAGGTVVAVSSTLQFVAGPGISLGITSGTNAQIEISSTRGSVAQVAEGGTGRSTLTENALLFGKGTNPVGMLTLGSEGQVLQVVSGELAWAAPPQPSLVTVPHGGTGISAVTANALLKGAGASPLELILPGTDGYVLKMVSGAPAWAAGGSGTVTSVAVTSSDLTVGGSPITSSGTITLALNTVGIAKGGTGQTTKTAAFDALSPLTTAGDVIYFDGTNNVRLAIGTEGQQLSVVSGAPAWSSGGTGTVTSVGVTSSTGILVDGSPITSSGTITAELPGTGTNSAVVAGDVLVGNGIGAYAALAKGSNGDVLTVDGSGDVNWVTPSAAPNWSTVTAIQDVDLGNFSLTNGNSLFLNRSASQTVTRGHGAYSVSADDLPYYTNADAAYAVPLVNNGGAHSTNQSLLIGNNAGSYNELLKGSAGQILTSDGTTVSWAAPATSGTVTSVAVTSSDLTVGGSPITSAGTITLALNTVGIAKGGTGQTTKTAAFDALSPLTTTGDVIYFDGTNNVRLAAGTNGQVLTLAAGVPSWAAISGTGTVTSVAVTSSDLTVGGSPITSSGTITLALNTVGIAKGGTGQTTKTAAFDALSPLTTAGDVIYFDGTNNVRLAIGTEGQQLSVVSGVPAWSAGGTGTVTSVAVTSSDLTVGGSPITSSGTITLALNTVGIAKGGTGQTTKTAAFDALSPLTTTGDVIYFDGTNNVRLAAGTNGQVLTLAAGVPSWAAASAGTVTSVAVTSSDLTVGGSPITSSGTITLALNTVGIAKGGTGQTTKTAAFDALSPLTTTGDVIYFDGTNNVRLAIGTEGQQLSVVSGVPAWSTGGTGTVTSVAVTSSDLTVGGSPITSSGTITLALNTVGIAKGGTGQTTKTAAFDALSPLTTAGDVIYFDGTNNVRLAAGTNGQVLTLAAGVPSWAAASAGTVTSVAVTSSDLTVGGSPITSAGTITLALNTVGIAKGGTGQTTKTAAFDALSPLTTAGDVIYFDGTNNVRLAAGTNGQVLTLAAGVPSWAAASAGTVTSVAVTSSDLTVGGSPITSSGTITLALNTVGIAKGGTGQTTKTAAFDALSPLTTTGDVIYFDGTNNVRLAAGTNGQVLTLAAGVPSWAAVSGTGTVTSVAVTSSDLTVGGSPITSAGTITLALNTVGIAKGGTGQTTKTAAFDALSPLTTTGDVIYFDGTNNVRLAAGTNGQVLTLAAGVPSWSAAGTGTVTSVAVTSSDITVGGSPITSSGTITLALNTVGISKGGTGQTTKAAAFNALSPLTTEGDIMFYASGTNTRLPIGSNGAFLGVSAGYPTWYASVVTEVAVTSSDLTVGGSPITSSGTITLALNTVGIAKGGTGQTTKTAAFDALSPLTTAGDVIYFDGTNNVRLAAGTNGQVLTLAAGVPSWAAASAGTVTSVAVTSSDLTVGGSPITSSGTITLALNTVGIAKGGTGQTTKTAAFDALSPLTTAGDVIYFDGTNNVRLAAGTNGQVLTLAAGVPSWAAASAGTVTSVAVTSSDLTVGGSPITSSGTITLALNTVGIAKGGTGQTTKTAAFDALSPLTTTGDVIYFDGTNNVRLAAGTNGQVLTLAAGVPSWAAVSGTGTVTSVAVTSSDLTVGGSPITSSGTITLALNTVGIAKGGTGQTTKTAAFDALSPLTTTGDVIYFDGTNNVRLAAGTNGQVLTLAAGVPSWASAGGTGTVTSVAVTSSDLTVGGSPITSSGIITLALNTVGISKGGTGQTTKAAAFDALCPTTTTGDISYYNGTNNVRLAAGSNSQVLTLAAGVPSWATLPAAPSVVSGGAAATVGNVNVAPLTTVNTTYVKANSIILLTITAQYGSPSGPSMVQVNGITANTSFNIYATLASGTTSVDVNWFIINP